MVTKDDGVSLIKSCKTFFMWSLDVTEYVINVGFSLPQNPWPPNF